MSTHEAKTGYEHDPSVYKDLVDQITFALDDAFTSISANEGRRAFAEFVQADTHSIRDTILLSALLTDNGGKPDRGVEKIRVLARPLNEEQTVTELAEHMAEGHGLVFQTNEFFIAHQSKAGEWRYSRVDEKGIYPWVPYLKDVTQNEQMVEFTHTNILDAIEIAASHSNLAEKRQMLQLDYAYAKELIAKIADWPLVPQN